MRRHDWNLKTSSVLTVAIADDLDQKYITRIIRKILLYSPKRGKTADQCYHMAKKPKIKDPQS